MLYTDYSSYSEWFWIITVTPCRNGSQYSPHVFSSDVFITVEGARRGPKLFLRGVLAAILARLYIGDLTGGSPA